MDVICVEPPPPSTCPQRVRTVSARSAHGQRTVSTAPLPRPTHPQRLYSARAFGWVVCQAREWVPRHTQWGATWDMGRARGEAISPKKRTPTLLRGCVTVALPVCYRTTMTTDEAGTSYILLSRKPVHSPARQHVVSTQSAHGQHTVSMGQHEATRA